MSLDKYFTVPEEARTAFIDKNIIGKLPEDSKERAKNIATKIVNDYVGQDLHALSVLAYAAEQGRFDEFVEKLEGHYQKSLKYVHPEARGIAQVPGVVRAEAFFLDCYKSMGIEPQK